MKLLICRYAYSGEAVDEDDEEAQSLAKGNSDGDIGMVMVDKERSNGGSASPFSLDEETGEEDKRE